MNRFGPPSKQMQRQKNKIPDNGFRVSHPAFFPLLAPLNVVEEQEKVNRMSKI